MTIFYYNKLPLTVYVHTNNKRRQTWMIKQHVAMVFVGHVRCCQCHLPPQCDCWEGGRSRRVVPIICGRGGSSAVPLCGPMTSGQTWPVEAERLSAPWVHHPAPQSWLKVPLGRLRSHCCGTHLLQHQSGQLHSMHSVNNNQDSCIQCTKSTTIEIAAFNALSQQQSRQLHSMH